MELLKGPLKEQALFKTAWLEGDYLDSETVSELSRLINTLPYRYHRIYDRIWESRAIPTYPLNASFLDSVLRPMSIPDRDLSWTEWIRENKRGIIHDLRQGESAGAIPSCYESKMYFLQGGSCGLLLARFEASETAELGLSIISGVLIRRICLQ